MNCPKHVHRINTSAMNPRRDTTLLKAVATTMAQFLVYTALRGIACV